MISLCDYIIERTGQIPDIREVAMQDQAYMTDLMSYDIVKAFLRSKRKRANG